MQYANTKSCWVFFVAGLLFTSFYGLSEQQRTGPGGDKVIVHLFEWSWRDVGLECKNFLGPKGFKAVQVSPAQEDIIGNQWWTRYQPVSYKLESRSGNEEEFRAMVDMCRNAGVDVIVDVVVNHMANPGTVPSVGRGGSTIRSRCDYPGTYSCADFHQYCPPGGCTCGGKPCDNCRIDYNACDADNIRHCNLWGSTTDPGLPDLDTTSSYVRNTIAGYLNKLAALGVAGVRVDASKHIDIVDMKAILLQVNSSLYVNHEVILRGGEQTSQSCITAPMFAGLGKLWEFKVPDVFNGAIKGKDLTFLRNMYSESSFPNGNGIWAYSPNALSFIVNHDRLVNGHDRPESVTIFDAEYAIANVILLAHPYGQPVLMSSLNFDKDQLDASFNFQQSPVNLTACKGDGKCPLIGVYDSSEAEPATPLRCAYGDRSRKSDPYHCEHRWPAIANMVAWRSTAGLSGITQSGAGMQYIGTKVLAITRGDGSAGKAFALVNIGDRFDADVDTKGMPAGQYCNVLASDPSCWPCQASCPAKVTVSSSSTSRLVVGTNEAVAFHINSMVGMTPPPLPPPAPLDAPTQPPSPPHHC